MILSNGPDAVDHVRLSLETSSAFWFAWVKYAGYAVAAGCAMEAPETFVIIKRWWLLRFKDDEREETKEGKRSWIVPLAAIGLIVIVVGIVVETFAEGKVSDFDALLRAHESDKITEAEGKAADAEARARSLELKAVELSDKTELEKIAALRIEAGVAGRRLTPTEVMPRPGATERTSKAVVSYFQGDSEARQFAKDIAEGLRKARWIVPVPTASGSPLLSGGNFGDAHVAIPSTPSGVAVTSGREERSAAKAIASSLKRDGFSVSYSEIDLKTSMYGIQILVETRPLGPQGAPKLELDEIAKQKTNTPKAR